MGVTSPVIIPVQIATTGKPGTKQTLPLTTARMDPKGTLLLSVPTPEKVGGRSLKYIL